MNPHKENKTEMVAPQADAKVEQTLAQKIESGVTSTSTRVISTPNKTADKKSTQAEKMVRIKLLRPYSEGGEHYEAGTVLEVAESVAARLCKVKTGHYKFSGERPDAEADRHNLTRAEKVN